MIYSTSFKTIPAEGDAIEKDMNSADEELPLEGSQTAPSLEAIEAHSEEDMVRHADLKERLTESSLATILLPS